MMSLRTSVVPAPISRSLIRFVESATRNRQEPEFISGCDNLPDHDAVTSALATIVAGGNNGGLGNHMWATVVDRDGEVCVVTYSGANRGSQWPGGRVLSAQRANTANAFSLPRLAFSTSNLYAATQPGGICTACMTAFRSTHRSLTPGPRQLTGRRETRW